jgi:hypothetical protein
MTINHEAGMFAGAEIKVIGVKSTWKGKNITETFYEQFYERLKISLPKINKKYLKIAALDNFASSAKVNSNLLHPFGPQQQAALVFY